MTKVTNEEIDKTMQLSTLMLTFATSQEPHVGMGALIMATAVGARAMNIPLENITAMFDKTASEIYTVAEDTGFDKTVN